MDRCVSWEAAIRRNSENPNVYISDINLGAQNIQSAAMALTLTAGVPEFGWYVGDWWTFGWRPPVALLTSWGMSAWLAPRTASVVVLFIGLTANRDIMDEIVLVPWTGGDPRGPVEWERVHVQRPSAGSWAQGAIYVARVDPASVGYNFPLTDFGTDESPSVVGAVESCGLLLMEVTYPLQDGDPWGGHAGVSLGTHGSATVNGARTITLSTAPTDDTGVTLAYGFAHTVADDAGSGMSSEDGDAWHEDHNSVSTQGDSCYQNVMSRAPGQAESTSPTVHWADVQTGSAGVDGAVLLAIEIKGGGTFNPLPAERSSHHRWAHRPVQRADQQRRRVRRGRQPCVELPVMPWEGPGLAGGGTGTAPRAGSYCPQGWEEDFDRSQMSTEVLIGRSAPSQIPVLRYNWVPAPGTPAAGQITLDGNQVEATHMYVHRTAVGGGDASVWLAYLHDRSTVTVKDGGDPAHVDGEGAPAPIAPRSRTYTVTGDVTAYPAYYDVPIFWTEGTEAVPPGELDVTLTISAEVPQLWVDTYGQDHYGRMTFNRTDLINTDRALFETLADRILRGAWRQQRAPPRRCHLGRPHRQLRNSQYEPDVVGRTGAPVALPVPPAGGWPRHL